MPLRRRQKLIEGEPSVLSRARREAGFGAFPEDDDEEEEEASFADRETEEAIVTAGMSAEGETAEGFAGVGRGAEEGLVGRAQPISRRSGEPVKEQLDRLAEQIRGLQQQLHALLARRGEAASETASQQVAAIVAAAEQSAAEIRASAEKDSAKVRERLLAEVQAEVERIRTEAQADAGRIRTEAHAEAARIREQAITEGSAEIQAVCSRLAEELQTAARTAIAGIAAGPRVSFSSSAEPVKPAAEAPRSRGDAATETDPRIVDEVEEAVDELQNAAAVLEQSLRHLRAIGSDPASD